MTEMGLIIFEATTMRELKLARERTFVAATLTEFARRPHLLTLWYSDHEGIQIYNKMHDVAERQEVGALMCEPVLGRMDIAARCQKFDGPISVLSVSKLLIEEGGVVVESGVELVTNRIGAITIVPGAYPMTLALSGLFVGQEHVYEPEYDIELYVKAGLDE